MPNRSTVSLAGPLYEQVQKMIKARILAGEWDPRVPLPGEVALSAEFGVSIGTVRRAMDQLAREHLLVRERGRGTFVRGDDGRRVQSAFQFCDPSGQPIRSSIRVIDVLGSVASADDIAALKLRGQPKLPPRVMKIRREWHQEGSLVCQELITVEEMRFPGLRQAIDETSESFFSIYDEAYGVKVESIQWEIQATRDGAADQVSTKGDGPTSVIALRRIAADSRGLTIETSEQRISLARCQVRIAT